MEVLTKDLRQICVKSIKKKNFTVIYSCGETATFKVTFDARFELRKTGIKLKDFNKSILILMLD